MLLDGEKFPVSEASGDSVSETVTVTTFGCKLADDVTAVLATVTNCRQLLDANGSDAPAELGVGKIARGSEVSVAVSGSTSEVSTELGDLVGLVDLCWGDEGVTVMVPVKGVDWPDSGESVYVSA